jgi:hypothetical protein
MDMDMDTVARSVVTIVESIDLVPYKISLPCPIFKSRVWSGLI